ncbi:hypothetical protein [Cryptosporangium aurantiacum]|uniref:DUF2306 domain-containing protein n=1 Tax=Cryptosporangium aurantiacum TaxID=134849 RepID=A0A1M7RA07_9ACTN|nr:hypothetical protein [Cryptosporangium aurantiacum]SHN43154.1 hypothetical protein SAMN05443668_10957 [Cryptosporangium aurantiacum]
MTYAVTLIVHIVAGVAGVLFGPVVLYAAAAGRVSGLAGAYHVSVLLVCVSAVVLSVLDFTNLWWFLLVAAGSYSFALRAVTVARRRHAGWLPRYIRSQGGAYIALWTAIVVVSVNEVPVVWLIPTAVGVPVIEWLSHRAHTANATIATAVDDEVVP